MNEPHKKLSRLLPVAYAMAAFACGASLSAQEAVKPGTEEAKLPKEGEVLQLSSFVVDASKDTGYQASNKVLWKAQLNIRNIVDSDALVAAYRNPDGTPAIFKIPEGRVWQVSSRFEF